MVWPFTTYKEVFFLLHIFCLNVWGKIGLPSSRNQGQDILLTCQGRCERWWNKRRHQDLWGDLFKNQHFISINTLRATHKVGFLSVMKAGKMLYLCLSDTIEAMIIIVGMTSVKFLARSCLYITDCSVILGGVLISMLWNTAQSEIALWIASWVVYDVSSCFFQLEILYYTLAVRYDVNNL